MRDGSYARWIPVGAGVERGRIYRKYCRFCGTSYSLIPDFVLPRRHYSCAFVAAWLWAWLRGAACRSRDFLVRHGVQVPTLCPGDSWSDLLDTQRTVPGYALLWRWSRAYSDRARPLAGVLVHLCIELRCDFKRDVAEALEALGAVPRAARPLAVTLGLWRAVMQTERIDATPVTLEEALPALTAVLARQQPVKPSHGLRRAFCGARSYDGGTVIGRSPPGPS